MQNFNVNSIIRFQQKEYQLRTSNNGRVNKIVCSLFREGEFINSKEIEYSKEHESTLVSLIKKFHEERKSELELFFNLSEKMESAGNSELQNMLGLIFEKNNLHIEAVQEFTRAIQRNPEDSGAYNNLGKTLLSLKKYDLAIKAFEKAITLSPDYADFYNNLGIVYLETGACKKAIQQFDRAISLNPYYAEAYFNRGLAYILNQIKREDYTLTSNYPAEVMRCLDQATLMNPGYQNQHYYTGLEYLKAEKVQEALEELKMAKDKGTHSSYLHDKYDYYLKLLFCDEDNNYDMIWRYIKFLQELLKKYPGHADIYNDLGLAYCMLRNYINERAIINFKNALKINPNFEKAKRNLKLSTYEKTGSEIFLKAITSKGPDAGKVAHQTAPKAGHKDENILY